MTVTMITALGGISGLIGFLSVLAYFYMNSSLKAAQRSVSDIIGADNRFSASQVLRILTDFKDEAHRLEALKVLTNYDTTKAKWLLSKIEGRIDISSIESSTSRYGISIARMTSIVFMALALLSFIYSIVTTLPARPETVIPQTAVTSTPSPTPLPNTASQSQASIADFPKEPPIFTEAREDITWILNQNGNARRTYDAAKARRSSIFDALIEAEGQNVNAIASIRALGREKAEAFAIFLGG